MSPLSVGHFPYEWGKLWIPASAGTTGCECEGVDLGIPYGLASRHLL